ncbi:flagellar hook capping protein [Achromobacter sp. Marseille-Q0513]|jgi:flagellar basal-body rod modification protein FlgD|uniref:flagellar hook assembly protein FlgD n=1 Tax=unclassified Achromobacter TaxID=2626865 RepID=UPI001B942745|nr:flagellar hook capping FlgD N-terminal domain-containing protein [Achromobacter sp. Marseille-Q0513]MBR8651697.1 flagellar hook capping protein [Achromobacter sp. Marseille-Q0513]
MAIDSTAAASASTQLGMQDLLKVLLAQLTNQNPLKPMENQDFIGQIAQFSSLEQSRQTYAKLDQLVTLQSTLQSVGLIGKTVDAQSPTGSITGTVTALSLASGTPTLSIRTSSGSVVNDVSLGSVSAIR